MDDGLCGAGHVVVVGASAAGIGTALGLRAHGHTGPITLIGDEAALACDRPPLSKGVLWGTQGAADIALAGEAELAVADIAALLGVAAASLDVGPKRVLLADGRAIDYDTLVIATGASSRMLPLFEGYRNVHTLRTWDDALALHRVLREGVRLGIAGGGLIGLEVAASATTLGARVTVVEPATQPLANRITPEVSEWLLDQHRAHGVELHLGAACAEVLSVAGEVTGMRVSDGAVIPVDVVLVAVGAVPNVAWLTGSGVEISDGVVVDEFQRALPDVYAVGDVANGYHPVYGRRMRMETRSNATEGAEHLARTLTGARTPFATVPFFWTDQYDVKLQSFGMIGDGDERDFGWGGLEESRWGLVGRRDGEVTGLLTRGFGPHLAQHRRALADTFADALAQHTMKGAAR